LTFFILPSGKVFAASATVSWNANAESDLAGYKIYYGTSARTGSDPKICTMCGYSTKLDVDDVRTYTFNNLTNGQTYYFSVSAYDTSNNESSFSAEVSKAIPAVDTTSPTIPGTPVANTVTTTTVALSWTASTDSVGVTGYRVYRGGSQIGTSASASYSDSDLTPATQYSYTVAAYDAAGNVSSQSSARVVTTQASADSTFPTVSITSPSSGATVSSTITVTAGAADNVGVSGVQFKLDGARDRKSVV
jgi:hypothetical protein